MAVLKRREAREFVVGLLFESEFRSDESYVEIFATSSEERLIPDDPYVKNAYYTINENLSLIDEKIGAHAHGWKTARLSRISRAVLRLAVYEMLFEKEIPFSVTINEAVELTKIYDEEKARPFVNGVLNSIKNEIVATGKEQCIKQCEQAVADAEQIPEIDAVDVADAAEAAADEEQ